MSTTLLLARHGQTVWHAENRYAGISDVPLTETGHAQAEALGRVVGEHAAALTHLAVTSQTDPDPGGYCPGPAPAWWKLAAADRSEPVARLRAWVEQVYRPGYGHLAAGLGACWPDHDLCVGK